MTGIFGILDSPATQWYQDVAPNQASVFFFSHRHIYGPFEVNGWYRSQWSHTLIIWGFVTTSNSTFNPRLQMFRQQFVFWMLLNTPKSEMDSWKEKRELSHKANKEKNQPSRKLFKALDSPRAATVWILTRWRRELNESLTENVWLASMSLDLGDLVRTRCDGLPMAKLWRARSRSRSGISVSPWISCKISWTNMFVVS